MTHELEYGASQLLGQNWAMLPEALADLVERLNHIGSENIGANMHAPATTGRHEGGTAIINIYGPILRYDSIIARFFGATTLDNLHLQLHAAMQDPNVSQIVLDIDSPGGTVSGLSDFARAVSSTGETKPITASISGMGASAAYWIASAASTIEVSDTAIVGSIGVAATFRRPSSSEIEIVSTQSPNKRPDPTTEGGRAELQNTIDALAEVFIGAVTEFRSMTRASILKIKGGVRVGILSVTAGLADSVASSIPATSEHQASEALMIQVQTNQATDQDLAAQWHADPNLQAEFSSPNIFTAFVKGARTHTVRTCGDGNVDTGRDQSTPTSINQLASNEELVAQWNSSPELQAEFSSPVIYAAYRIGERDFNVRVLG